MTGRAPLPGALVFDFDGLILDTESPTYDAVARIFAEHEVDLELGWWHSTLGTSNHVHWTDVLADRVGRPLNRDELVARREQSRLVVIESLAVSDGLVDLLDGAEAAGVPCAVASSSGIGWVGGHLDRLRIRDRFAAVITSDDVGRDPRRTKPAPDLFLAAAAALGVDPASCVVLEDSPNGVAAGRAAGMVVVAVPGPMTAPLDFSAAHLVVPSLAAVDVNRLGRLAATV
jgi:HAD superfamily hydrolase (TIGR01509 family)